ncbi:hypothetical protein AK812_SmicGene29807 [Symbiodinium microadriaticum]|uniref:Uncharacterized protein n=1 Tax=Symbiodinium microadriaticum TaxID=2951 RepID=A0A1Q9D0W3_SYMMI|nr:hypothetical protein AK812_SmicGene29807 [Symbiodinium microadriaticum]
MPRTESSKRSGHRFLSLLADPVSWAKVATLATKTFAVAEQRSQRGRQACDDLHWPALQSVCSDVDFRFKLGPSPLLQSFLAAIVAKSENRFRRQRRQGFPALGISVLESATDVEHATDLLDIKFRGLEVDRRRSELDLQSATVKGRTKEQAQILAITHGLQEGIEDLLAGRIFRPGESDEVAVDSSSADSDSSSLSLMSRMLAAVLEAGMPGWMKGEVSEDEDIDDIVQETDHSKIEQQAWIPEPVPRVGKLWAFHLDRSMRAEPRLTEPLLQQLFSF